MSFTEPGLGPLRRTHHYARIPGGENRPLCLWSKNPATHESKQQSERWAEAHAEKGTHRAPPIRSLTSRAGLEGAGAQRSAEHFSCTVRTLSGVEAQPVFSNHGRTTLNRNALWYDKAAVTPCWSTLCYGQHVQFSESECKPEISVLFFFLFVCVCVLV